MAKQKTESGRKGKAVEGCAVDSGFRMKHPVTGRELVLLIDAYAEDGGTPRFTGWLETVDRRVPLTVRCDEHACRHEIVSIGEAIRRQLLGTTEDNSGVIGIEFPTLIAGLLEPHSRTAARNA